jgi:hypothetical protein
MNKKALLAIAIFVACFGFVTKSVFASSTGIIFPTSDGNYLQWTPSTGVTHYTLVDETARNTTDYVFSNTTSQRDSYGVNISSIGNGASISQIGITPCASRSSGSGGGSSTMDVFYRYNGADSSVTGSYALRNSGDEVGYPCSRTSSTQCSDCGSESCAPPTETCCICRRVRSRCSVCRRVCSRSRFILSLSVAVKTDAFQNKTRSHPGEPTWALSRLSVF